MLEEVDENWTGTDQPLSSGWSFTESEEAAFFESERRRKTMSHILEHRIGYVPPQGHSVPSGCQIMRNGFKHLASQSRQLPEPLSLETRMTAVLSCAGEILCAEETDAEDRTLYFQMEDNDLFIECANQIPDLIQSEHPGYRLCIYRMQYCFESSEKTRPFVLLKVEFSEEIMAYTAAVTLAHWSSKANFKVDLACSDMNSARCLRTLICRLDRPLASDADAENTQKSLEFAQSSSNGILAKAKHTFKLIHGSVHTLDIDKGDDNNSVIIKFLNAEQAAKFLLSIPEADLDGVKPLKYHIPAFEPKWCKTCHRFGHEHNLPDAICDLPSSHSGCGACAISGANLSTMCGGPYASDPRTCWTYVLKEALYEGQRIGIEAIDCHALVPLNIAIHRHEEWTRERKKLSFTKSESDIEKVVRENPKNVRRRSHEGSSSVDQKRSEHSRSPDADLREDTIQWGYSWYDIDLSFWEQSKKQ